MDNQRRRIALCAVCWQPVRLRQISAIFGAWLYARFSSLSHVIMVWRIDRTCEGLKWKCSVYPGDIRAAVLRWNKVIKELQFRSTLITLINLCTAMSLFLTLVRVSQSALTHVIQHKRAACYFSAHMRRSKTHILYCTFTFWLPRVS